MGQTLATSQWYVYGRKHFRQPGYSRHVKEYYGATTSSSSTRSSGVGSGTTTPPVQLRADIGKDVEGADGVDLKDKVIVVTGANSGLGKEMATYASAKGAKLYMICRSKERAEKARDEIVNLTSNDNIKVVLADVGELEQVRSAAKEIQSQESNIDCLVCNAGVLLNEKQMTCEGNESTIASHLIGGSYLLTKLLLPQLKAVSSSTCTTGSSNNDVSRVIYVTSGGMLLTKFPSWDIATNQSPNAKYDGTMAYAYAKRGQVLLAEEMTKLYPEIKFVSAHPGWVDTKAVDDAFGSGKKVLEPMRSTWEGAEGITWLMGVSSDKIESGGFYLDRKVQEKHIAGPFMSDGSYTKNTDVEVQEFMDKLKEVCGI